MEADPKAGRLAGAQPVAIIDIGSNSVRLVVYERHARAPTPIYNESFCAGSVAVSPRLDGCQRTPPRARSPRWRASGSFAPPCGFRT
jgi:hypothetical protein